MAKRKAAPAWRRVFLRALARSGNVRTAALEAGVDVTTAYTHRGRDAAFAARWEKAKGRTRAPLDGTLDERPGREAPAGMVLRHSRREGAQWVKAGEGRWSARAEADFFAELGRTACVRRAAEACGFSTTALYKRRGRYAGFAAKWDAIEERAKMRIHGYLVSATIASFDPELEGEGLPRVSVSEGIAIYRLKGPASPLGAGEKLGARFAAEEPDIEAVRDEVLARLAAIRAHRERRGGEDQ
jgi:hypothetical protein